MIETATRIPAGGRWWAAMERVVLCTAAPRNNCRCHYRCGDFFMIFNLEAPSERALTDINRFGGWYVPQTPGSAKLQIWLDGQPRFALSHGHQRMDVKNAHPTAAGSLQSGFFGDVWLAENSAASNVNLQIVDV